MRRYVIAMTACLLLSLPAQGATILFPEPVAVQTEMATDDASLLAAILSSVFFAASEPQTFEASEGFPLYISVVVSQGEPVVVPEPSSLLLSCLGMLGLTFLGRRRSV